MYEDKTLTCRDCGTQFVFTAGEQEFFAEKGLVNEPQRCPDCRKQHKEERRNKKRVMYDVVCAECGKPAKVPFQPTEGGKPVYCDECFAAHKEN